MANPFDQFDRVSAGGNAFDQFDTAAAPKLQTGMGNFKDALKQTLAETDPGTRFVAGVGVAASDLIERAKQLFGKENRSQIEANKIIAKESPVGAFAGDALLTGIPIAKFMPVLGGSPTIAGKVAQYAGNVGIGAAAGAGLAALKPDANAESIGEGALGGGIASGVVAPAITQGAKAAGWLYDTMRGARQDLSAGKILRDAAGSDLSKIRAANSAAPEDLTAAQAAFGIDRDTWSALGELAKRNDKESFYRVLADRQVQAQRDTLAKIAEGANQTEARASRLGTKDTLNAITTPMRETELNAANTAGKLLPKLQGDAQRFGDAAASKVQDVRRMADLGVMADDMSQAGRNTFDGTKNLRGLELGKRAESVAQQSADASLPFGEAARFAQARADSLAQHGLTPIDSGAIVRGLQAKINDPTIGPNEFNRKALQNVGQLIQKWEEKNGGVIDAKALYEIRKSAVNNIVEKLMGAAEPKAIASRQAEVMSKVRPLIDDAIEAAGGTGWRNYLDTFSKGMDVVNQKKMGAVALDLFDKSKDKFVSLARGNEPKAVEKVFGSGNYDIASQMGDKINPMRNVADQIERDRLIGERGAGASNALADILSGDSMRFRLPALFTREATVANKTLDYIEGKINRKTMDSITKAMRSGRSANEAIDMLPISERNHLLLLLKDNANPIAVTGVSAAQ